MFKGKVHMVVRLQSLWRGYSARQQVNLIRQTKRADSRYFTIDEQRETVTNQKYDPHAVREERPTYTFRSGATYTG